MAKRSIRLLNTTRAAAAAARWLAGELDLEPAREKTLRFGLDIIFSWATGMGLVALCSAALGSLVPGMAAAIAAFVLRVFSAGAHCSSSGRCALLTAFVYVTIGRAASVLDGVFGPGAIVGAYGASIVFLFFRARPRDPRDARNLRLSPVAVALLTLYMLLSLALRGYSSTAAPEVVAVSLGCLWQAFTVTEPGVRVVLAVDRLLGAVGVE